VKPKINIVILVDVIGALSEETLARNVCMMDDGTGQSTGQGTPELSTACRAGQVIQWTVRAIDLQTPVEIRSITFPGAGRAEEAPAPAPVHGPAPAAGCAAPVHGDDLGLNAWSGVVPPHLASGTTYGYRLELQMYEGGNSVMSIDTPSLRCL
jgi:hypothetical protein